MWISFSWRDVWTHCDNDWFIFSLEPSHFSGPYLKHILGWTKASRLVSSWIQAPDFYFRFLWIYIKFRWETIVASKWSMRMTFPQLRQLLEIFYLKTDESAVFSQTLDIFTHVVILQTADYKDTSLCTNKMSFRSLVRQWHICVPRVQHISTPVLTFFYETLLIAK